MDVTGGDPAQLTSNIYLCSRSDSDPDRWVGSRACGIDPYGKPICLSWPGLLAWTPGLAAAKDDLPSRLLLGGCLHLLAHTLIVPLDAAGSLTAAWHTSCCSTRRWTASRCRLRFCTPGFAASVCWPCLAESSAHPARPCRCPLLLASLPWSLPRVLSRARRCALSSHAPGCGPLLHLQNQQR